MGRSDTEPAAATPPPRGESAMPPHRPPAIQPRVESARVVERHESIERREVERHLEQREMTRVVERQMAAPPAAIQPKISTGAVEAAAPREPEPAIVVTIGRIDIRAHTPAETPRAGRARTVAPAVPLDEYLRRRSQGERG